MSNFPVLRHPLPRRGLLALGMASLAGCAAVSKPIVIDHAAMAEIRRVSLPTVGFPASPTVTVMNTVTDRLGLVGQITGAIIRKNRMEAVRAMMASQAFDPHAHFHAALAERLRARRLIIAPEPADPARQAFLAKYEPAPGHDAVLDAFIVGYGFLALDDRDASPFRPTVILSTRLVQATNRSVMMQDTVTVNGVDDVAAPSNAPPPRGGKGQKF